MYVFDRFITINYKSWYNEHPETILNSNLVDIVVKLKMNLSVRP